MSQTPSSMRSRPSSASLEAPNAAAASPSSSRHSTLESRRALGARASGMARDPGTPVGRLLAAEGLAVRSPRRVRHRSLADKVIDWPSNALMSLETSVQLLSFESAGYPAALAFHLVHLVVRVSAFVPSLSSITSTLFSSASSASRYVRRPADALGDADARLEALQRASQGHGGGAWGWWAWTFSALLILVSVGNSAYLASRRRKYQMMLRRDPLASPNARSTMLDFSPSKRHVSFTESVRRRVKAALGKVEVEESHAYPVQELQVWTPERVLWSLRFFTLYPPPVAVMYHFLALDNCVPFAIVGGTIVLTIYLLVHLYSTLVSDRAALQAEVMHEYNAKFVNPRVFVAKRDACVSTSQAEMVGANDWLRAGRRHVLDESLGQDDEQHVVVRGSGRRATRRDSSVPSMQQREVEGVSDSPVPRRSRPRPSMLG